MNIFKVTIILAAALLSFSMMLQAQNKSMVIVSTETVAADQQEVYDLLRSFDRFGEWSPYLESDPNQINRVEGANGETGCEFHWLGVDEKSEGHMVLAETQGGDYLKMNCFIRVPFDSQSSFEYQLKEENGQTLVTQTFTMNCSGFQKMMLKVLGVTKDITEVNALGLTKLKAALESNEVEVSIR